MDYPELHIKIKHLTNDYYNQMIKKQFVEAYKTSIELTDLIKKLQKITLKIANVSE